MNVRRIATFLFASFLAFSLHANSLEVNSDAALGGVAQNNCSGDGMPGPCGLEVDYTGAGSLAYVQSGGIGGGNLHPWSDETSIKVTFLIDPGDETSDPKFHVGRNGYVRIANFFEDFTPGTGVKVILFLQHSANATGWRLLGWVRQDTGPFVFCGGGFLTGATPAFGAATEVVFEWSAATGPGMNDGVCRATKDGINNPNDSPTLVFQRTNLDNDTHALNMMRLGSVSASENSGAPVEAPNGVIHLDEVAIVRN